MVTLNRPAASRSTGEKGGDGPFVVISSYWSMHPSSFEPLTRELRDDHRVVTYHALPKAHVETVDDGLISRPDQVAAVVRRLTSADPSPR